MKHSLQYIELERLNHEKVDNLNSEIEKLKEALKNSGAPLLVRPALSAAERLYDRLELSQLSLLDDLNILDGTANEEMLIQVSKEPKLRVQYDLLRRGFLERNFDNDDTYYSFTHEGRKALLLASESSPAAPDEHRGGAMPSASEHLPSHEAAGARYAITTSNPPQRRDSRHRVRRMRE
jgi:hypothetical protein